MALAEVDYLNGGGGSKGVSATFTGITSSNPIVFDCGFIPKYVCIGSMHSDPHVGAVILEYIDGVYYETTIYNNMGWRNTNVLADFTVNGSTVTFRPPDGSWASSYSFCATEEYLGNQ